MSHDDLPHLFGTLLEVGGPAHCSEIDLILMDLRMPVMTGVEATRLIREQSETCRVPVVAMSAHCEGSWREEALGARAVDSFSKPLEFSPLDEILARYAS